VTPSIAVVDYGAGNLTSVLKALTSVGAFPFLTNRPDDVMDADAIVIPGVGHFGATRNMDDTLRDALCAASGVKPLLGVCLGLQFLFDGSEEAPDVPGLGLLEGRCFLLPPTQKVPHVGWNTVDIDVQSRILHGVSGGSAFYFTHSYAAPVTDVCVGRTTYTAPFAAVIEWGNVYGAQFHPEKSGDAGLTLLRNFVGLVRS
jgi:imidazole glycerol-phosphate synthase subunit HisH